jgi:hypothetical protein
MQHNLQRLHSQTPHLLCIGLDYNNHLVNNQVMGIEAEVGFLMSPFLWVVFFDDQQLFRLRIPTLLSTNIRKR